MNSDLKKCTPLKIFMPIQRRINHINMPLIYGFSGDGDVVFSKILMSPTNPSSRKLPDYEPGKYREVHFRPVRELQFRGNENSILQFKNDLREIIISGIKNLKLVDESLVDEQIQRLLILFIQYDIKTVIRKYRADTRKKEISFYPEMAKFIKASSTETLKSGVKIEYGIGKTDFVEFPAPLGNQHLMEAMSNFFLEYYTKNQPAKNLFPLTEELVMKNCEMVLNGMVKFDQELLDSLYIDFYFCVLNVIRRFPQFKKPQRQSDFNLTEMEGRFLANFLHLIDFDLWKKSNYLFLSPRSQPMSEDRRNETVRNLRNVMRKFSMAKRSSGHYTT